MPHLRVPLTRRSIIITALLSAYLAACQGNPVRSPPPLPQEAKLIGKWETIETSSLGGAYRRRIEFLKGGNFARYRLTGGKWDQTSVGTYKFIDSTHIRLDVWNIPERIYEVVSVTDKELKLRAGDKFEIWTRVE